MRGGQVENAGCQGFQISIWACKFGVVQVTEPLVVSGKALCPADVAIGHSDSLSCRPECHGLQSL